MVGYAGERLREECELLDMTVTCALTCGRTSVKQKKLHDLFIYDDEAAQMSKIYDHEML